MYAETDPGEPPPRHGGGLREAARRYRIPADSWLDLSTGINPRGWPVPTLPAGVWRRLPEEGDGLESSAAACYGTTALLPVAGSQVAIQLLPRLRRPARVAIATPGYAEHAHAWLGAGHSVTRLPPERLEEALPDHEVMVAIHPNNPTGHRYEPGRLLEWHEQLRRRGGWLVVDEAFIDATPEASVTPFAGRPGLVVLRSLGKFFGLAGLRAGFVCADRDLLEAMRRRLGPWHLSGPARWVASRALDDHAWQAGARSRLAADSRRLQRLLASRGLTVAGATPLFAWVLTPAAERIRDALCRRGILTRRFDTPPSLRFGLPGDETQWQRLEEALDAVLPGAGA